MGEQTADVLSARRRCRRDCDRTSGTYCDRGHVRRCAHGRIWQHDHGFGRTDYWVPLWPFPRVIAYRRALRALAAEEVSER